VSRSNESPPSSPPRSLLFTAIGSGGIDEPEGSISSANPRLRDLPSAFSLPPSLSLSFSLHGTHGIRSTIAALNTVYHRSSPKSKIQIERFSFPFYADTRSDRRASPDVMNIGRTSRGKERYRAISRIASRRLIKAAKEETTESRRVEGERG